MMSNFSRREFLQTASVAAGGLVASNAIRLEAQPMTASPQQAASGDRVRFGMIGIGMQGSGLLGMSVNLPGVECVGAADLRLPHSACRRNDPQRAGR